VHERAVRGRAPARGGVVGHHLEEAACLGVRLQVVAQLGVQADSIA
jgi:hypothetical protein